MHPSLLQHPTSTPSKDCFSTPTKPVRAEPSLTELYQSSLRKPPIQMRKCLLCLLCSADCDNSRCADPSHVTCRDCTYEWHLDRTCPLCQRDQRRTIRKNKNRPEGQPNTVVEEPSQSSRWQEREQIPEGVSEEQA